jgi:hypothetical protein
MAQATLPASPSPEFPQVLDLAINRIILRVDRVLSPVLDICQYEYPETRPGACNGFPCAANATVFDLSEERELCAKHFREVNRG